MTKARMVRSGWSFLYSSNTFSSLYPWIRNMFGIDNEVDPFGKYYHPEKYNIAEVDIFHGNEMFKVKGYYDISHQSKIAWTVL